MKKLMKKLIKRIITLTLCVCMMIGIITPASARNPNIMPLGSPSDAVHWRSTAKSGYMNAYVWNPSSVVHNTKVTLWGAYDNSTTQKFYTDNHRLRCAANTSLNVGPLSKGSGNFDAYLLLNSYQDQLLDFIPSGSYYKIHTYDGVLALYPISSPGTSQPLTFSKSYTFVENQDWELVP